MYYGWCAGLQGWSAGGSVGMWWVCGIQCGDRCVYEDARRLKHPQGQARVCNTDTRMESDQSDLASEHSGRWDLDDFDAILYKSMLDDAGRQASP